MDQSTISKFGWIAITVITVLLLVLGMQPTAKGLVTQIKDVINENIEVYTVTLDANGGSVTQTEINVSPGKTYGYLPTPVKEGAIFLGWYTESGVKIASHTKYNGSAEHTLYARWEDN